MAEHETFDLTLPEAEKTSVIIGEVTAIDKINKTLDVKNEDVEYAGLKVFYHCTTMSTADGFAAFSVEDMVLVLNKTPNDPIDVENLTVIGFADGYPRMCMERLILFSVPDGNPSTYYSAASHVLWSIDEEEIVMGPCSLQDLLAAGYIDQLAPLVIRGYGIATGSLIFDHADDAELSANAICSAGNAPDMNGLDNVLIWEPDEETGEYPHGPPPVYSGSCADIVPTMDITDERLYNDFSTKELNSEAGEGFSGNYGTTPIEDFLVGWIPQPSFYIKTYSFQTTGSKFSERAKLMTPLMVYNLDGTPRFSSGAFFTSRSDSQWTIATGGWTRWINSGSFFTSSVGERRRDITDYLNIDTVVKYYSPIGTLAQFPEGSGHSRTLVVLGTNDPVVTQQSTHSLQNDFETKVFSAISAAEKFKVNGEVVEQQTACAVYVLSGDVVSSENGSTGSEAIDPKVNVSVDTFDATTDFNPFTAQNIPVLATALESALKNSDGGEAISTYFFKGKIQ